MPVQSDAVSQRRKLAAILSADVAGYSRLMGEDEQATVQTLQSYRALIQNLVSSHHGRVVNAPGDALLAEFPSAVEAVRCAGKIQDQIEIHNAPLPEERRMRFRIGVNLGDVIEEADGTLYGDGVNVAARLEALAEPGGVSISGKVFDEVDQRIDMRFKAAGEQQVKNIAKPIRAYHLLPSDTRVAHSQPRAPESDRKRKRLKMMAATASVVALAVAVGLLRPWERLGSRTDPAQALSLPTGPAIAVLAFDNLSGDPGQEYFADGLAEDILTRLSRFSDIKVIGRNSSFKYKGKTVDVREVGRDLKVDYVLEGSVRRSADAVRINAQLLNANDGSHVWAETYDRSLTGADIFGVQDDITARIVAMLADNYGAIARRRATEVLSKPSTSVDTYDCVLRARTFWQVLSVEAHLTARTCLEEAIKRDPTASDAWAWLAHLYLVEYWAGHNARSQLYDPRRKGLEAAQRAVSLEPASQLAHWSLAYAHFYLHDIDAFLSEADVAVGLNPNNASVISHVGLFILYVGEWERGIKLIDKAVQLNPYHPPWYNWGYHNYYYNKREYELALRAAQQIGIPDVFWTPLCLAEVYAQLGRGTEARAAAERIAVLYPGFNSRIARSEMEKFNFPEDHIQHRLDGLRKAGVPE